MKIRLPLALVGLAISFALPTFAQQIETADPQLRQDLLALAKKVDDAWNNNDAAAVAALYTKDAVEVTNEGPIYGREAIEKYFTELFQRFNPSDRSTKLGYVYVFGGDLCAIGVCTVIINGPHPPPHQAGWYLVNVYTPVRDTWKISAAVFKYATGP